MRKNNALQLPPPCLNKSLFLKAFFMISCGALFTTNVFAFGGGGGSGQKSTVYENGVDAIGVHFGGNPLNCPEHSTKVEGFCVCDLGFVTDMGECIPNQCIGFEPTDCITDCNQKTGERTYAELCHNEEHYCNAEHECINPCKDVNYSDCQICTAVHGEAQIKNKDNDTLCKDQNDQYNHICTNGVCQNPCTQESTTCISHTPQAGVCNTTIHADLACDSSDEYKICGAQGACDTCINGYEMFNNACMENCADGYVRNQTTGVCELICSANEECASLGTCMGCVVPDGADSGTCQYACEEVEYLESTGTQYMNTGVIFSDTFSWEVNFKGLANDATLLGARDNQVRTGILFRCAHRNGKTTIPLGNTNCIYTPFDLNHLETGEHTVKIQVANAKASIWVDSNVIYSETAFSGNYTPNLPFVIFAGNVSGNVTEFSSSKIYYVKMWNHNILIRDFIPVLAPTQTGLGLTGAMLDQVENKLYYNQGTGEFITGPIQDQ